jgi:ABC-type sugar transport system permease subunit
VYEQDPSMGVANAVVTSVHDTFAGGSRYPGASAREGDKSPDIAQGGAVVTRRPVQSGAVALVPLVGVKPENLPKTITPAKAPAVAPGGVSGLVWFDFTKGGGGTLNSPDASEAGLGGMRVQAVSGGKVVGSATTEKDGSFVIKKLPAGSYTLKLPKGNFAASYGGVDWLGSALITPAIIASYLWVWAGFAMVLIAAGLAAIPRDALEAARVDGATEWQVFRRVTIPLLAPVLTVVFVTLLIYALKVFDLVFIIGGGDPNASVLAVRMWTDSFGGGNNQGAGSAVAIMLFLLVVPAMLFNLRRFRQESR